MQPLQVFAASLDLLHNICETTLFSVQHFVPDLHLYGITWM